MQRFCVKYSSHTFLRYVFGFVKFGLVGFVNNKCIAVHCLHLRISYVASAYSQSVTIMGDLPPAIIFLQYTSCVVANPAFRDVIRIKVIKSDPCALVCTTNYSLLRTKLTLLIDIYDRFKGHYGGSFAHVRLAHKRSS